MKVGLREKERGCVSSPTKVSFLHLHHVSSTIATSVAKRPREWLGTEYAFVPNWTVPCTIRLLLYPPHCKITAQAVYTKVSPGNPTINTD